jgi:flagellar biosynthesis protein FliR
VTLTELARAFYAHPEWSRQIDAHALLLARLAPLAWITPLLGLRQMSPVLRATATLALGLSTVSAATLADDASLGPGTLLGESITGAFFAIVAALPLYALGMGGRLVDLVRGVAHPGERDLVEYEPSSALGHLMAMTGLALFFTIGGHRLVVRAFAEGLTAVPLGAATLSPEALFGFAMLAGKALLFGASIALPAFATVLLVEVFLGLFARAAPTIPVFHAGMPLRAFAGLTAIAVTLGLGLRAFAGELGHAVQTALGWLSAAP